MNLQHGGNVFAIAREHNWQWEEIADFSASINPLGPSPAVFPAIQAAMGRIVHYPEIEPAGLRDELAETWGVPPACVMLGNGATELIYFLARILRLDFVHLAAPVFSEFHRVFPDANIVPFDSAKWPDSGLVIVTRPANPTGQVPRLDGYLRNTRNPVLIDESFLDFTELPSLADAVGWRENTYILRSLTKFYALPGLRVGALIAPASAIAQWRTQREPWQVNVLAEAAARAAIADKDHCNATLAYVRTERAWLEQQLAKQPGAKPQPSMANYLLVALNRSAAPLLNHLLQTKIVIRDCSGWPGVEFPHAVRVAVRTRVENERLISSWREYACG